MNRHVLAAAALVALAACGKPAPRPPAPTASAPKPTAQAPAPAEKPAAQAAPAEPEWSYSAAGKRDPFRSFLSEVATQGNTFGTKCPGPLGRFDVEQFRLVAVITGLEDPVAMVQAPSGVGYTVRRGACIGKSGGTIAAVRSGEVLITEWVVRADGTRDSTQTALRLPKEAAPSLEE